MKNKILELFKEVDINKVGFCNPHHIVVDYSKYNLQNKLDYKCPFQVGSLEDKDLTADTYKIYNTVIAVLLPNKKVKYSNKDKVYFSSVSVGEDYHKVLKDKLKYIGEFLEKEGYKYKIFVDNNPLDEKLLAYNCGLGFFGKNNLLINDEFGSYFNIGIILTDAVIESDNIIKSKCGNCNICIKSCPNGALNDSGILNAKKCLSYLTQKSNLDNINTDNFNNCIYGCDVCMSVCPYNKKIEYADYDGMDINEFLNMSEEEFKKKYSNVSAAWRGKKVLDHNISIYLKNLDK